MLTYFLIATPLALLAGALSRRYVEQPAINWARKRIVRRNAARSATAAVAPAPA
jgi:peptidoglycan/LPS O-acetylase OafA/YrhL